MNASALTPGAYLSRQGQIIVIESVSRPTQKVRFRLATSRHSHWQAAGSVAARMVFRLRPAVLVDLVEHGLGRCP